MRNSARSPNFSLYSFCYFMKRAVLGCLNRMLLSRCVVCWFVPVLFFILKPLGWLQQVLGERDQQSTTFSKILSWRHQIPCTKSSCCTKLFGKRMEGGCNWRFVFKRWSNFFWTRFICFCFFVAKDSRFRTAQKNSNLGLPMFDQSGLAVCFSFWDRPRDWLQLKYILLLQNF